VPQHSSLQPGANKSLVAGKKRTVGWNTVKAAHHLASSLKGRGSGDASSPRSQSSSTMHQLLKPSSSYRARAGGLAPSVLSPSSSALNLDPSSTRSLHINSSSQMNCNSVTEVEDGPGPSRISSALGLGSRAQVPNYELSSESGTIVEQEAGACKSEEAMTAPEEITLGVSGGMQMMTVEGISLLGGWPG
jgi:hypothetical protein